MLTNWLKVRGFLELEKFVELAKHYTTKEFKYIAYNQNIYYNNDVLLANS